MAQTVHINGLNAIVQPDAQVNRSPTLLTEQEVAQIVRFPGPIVAVDPYAPDLIAIQGYCQWWANVGRNARLVGVEDFAIAIMEPTHDPVPAEGEDGNAVEGTDIYVDPGVQLVVKHRETGKTGQYDLRPPKGVSADNYYRQTASAMVELGTPDPQPNQG